MIVTKTLGPRYGDALYSSVSIKFSEYGEQEEQSMGTLLRVGIIGDFVPQLRHHLATNEALGHAAHALSLTVETTWLPTESLDNADCEATLKRFDALWCAPASPYKSMRGALKAIQWAREKDWPFFGT
jgi:CTP synthase (UTP-ammonia lyase)